MFDSEEQDLLRTTSRLTRDIGRKIDENTSSEDLIHLSVALKDAASVLKTVERTRQIRRS